MDKQGFLLLVGGILLFGSILIIIVLSDFSQIRHFLSSEPCYDSDWGSTYYLKGTVTGTTDKIAHSDFCILSPDFLPDGYILSDRGKEVKECAGNECYLVENFCPADYSKIPFQYIHEGHKCEHGCVDGRCRIFSSPKCIDYDAGKDYNTKSSVYSQTGTNTEDVCVTDKILREYYCDNGLRLSEGFACPFGCREGACIQDVDLTWEEYILRSENKNIVGEYPLVEIEVVNLGAVPSDYGYSIKFEILFGGKAVNIEEFEQQPLPPGEGRSFFHRSSHAYSELGQYEIRVTVDARNIQRESNELNNVKSMFVDIQ